MRLNHMLFILMMRESQILFYIIIANRFYRCNNRVIKHRAIENFDSFDFQG